MKTIRKFLPEKPVHILLLLTAVCLVGSLGRNWLDLRVVDFAVLERRYQVEQIRQWILSVQAASWLTLLAGVGAYVCMLRRWSDKSVRLWTWVVTFPSVLAVVFGIFVTAAMQASYSSPQSILDQSKASSHSQRVKDFVEMAVHYPGVALKLAVLGMVLAIICDVLQRNGVIVGPMRFAGLNSEVAEPQEDRLCRPEKIFIVSVLTVFALLMNAIHAEIFFAFNFLSEKASSGIAREQLHHYLQPSANFIGALFLLGMASWSFARSRNGNWRQKTEPNLWRFMGFSVVLAIAAYMVPHLFLYAGDRILWAQHWAVIPDMPALERYLRLPEITWPVVLFGIGAGIREWAWRGYVQPGFVRAFGLARGIFLVGLVGGMLLEFAVPSIWTGVPDFSLQLVGKLIWGVAWAIVLGWLTLRAASVLPAITFNFLDSILVQGGGRVPLGTLPRHFIGVGALIFSVALAAALLKYGGWPTDDEPTPVITPASISESMP